MSIKYIAIAAMTLDGKIAKDSQHLSTDWTSEEDKIYFRKVLKICDVVLIGKKTWETAKEPLSKRNCIVFSRSENQIDQTNQKNPIFVNPSKTDVKKLISESGYKRVAILGGAQTYAFCLENGMLDELYLTIEPIVFGNGINLFTANSFLDAKFKLVSSEKLNPQGTLLLRYKKVDN